MKKAFVRSALWSFTFIGGLFAIDKIVTKSYKDGVKRGIEIGEYGKTTSSKTKIED